MKPDRYRDILQQAQADLSAEEQSRLAEELSRGVARKNGATHRITDLKGLGKELWQGVDVDAFVAGERDSWDG